MLFQKHKRMLKRQREEGLKAACYQAYAEFIRGLYEYYVAIIKWDEGKTSLPKEHDLDATMNDVTQRLMNFYRPTANTKQHEEYINVPEEFDQHFR